MRYFYARVSTAHQNLARQMDAADGIENIDAVFCDKQSGKSFDRPEYRQMKSLVTKGDEVIFKSLDRLGRNKAEMMKEVAWFRDNGILIRVLDLPTTMIEFPVGQEWVLELVNNILFEVLGTIAEQERLTTQRRREEGIAAMPVVDGKRVSSKTGRGFGRPKIVLDKAKVSALIAEVSSGKRTAASCWKELNIGKSKWYELVKTAI